MLQIEQKIIDILKADATLVAIVPAANMFVGPSDVIQEKQAELFMPQINIQMVSEVVRTVPSGARDSVYQLDIWSRVSQLQLEQIYERILTLLNYDSGDKNTAHLYWERLDSAVDLYESDRRIWHRACSFRCWSD